MIKTIKIDGRDVKLKATGATPVIFQEFFGEDLLLELNGKFLSEDTSTQSTATKTINQLCFVMNKQAEGLSFSDFNNMGIEAYMEWLDSFSFGGLVEASLDVIRVLQEDAVPAAELKKTKESQE